MEADYSDLKEAKCNASSSSSSSLILLIARNSLTLSHHPSLYSIAPSSPSKLRSLSALSWCKKFLAGRPTLARLCKGVHRRKLLLSSSLLLQQRFTCSLCLTWMVHEMEGNQYNINAYYIIILSILVLRKLRGSKKDTDKKIRRERTEGINILYTRWLINIHPIGHCIFRSHLHLWIEKTGRQKRDSKCIDTDAVFHWNKQ